MKKIPKDVIHAIQILRKKGKTYSEINVSLGLQLAKSTLSYICKDIELPLEYQEKIKNLNSTNLNKGRAIAVELNKIRRKKFLEDIYNTNYSIGNEINRINSSKIALAMLCLGEASKSSSKGSSFNLGSSDPRIIVIFLSLLKRCYKFDKNKVRCTVQCRADQDIEVLKKYWMSVTNIEEKFFYKPLIDPRTKGKSTRNMNYKGVLRVDYFDKKIQLELESLAQVVYNYCIGPVAQR